MALKSVEKAVDSALQGPSSSKIPVALNSPRKKSKRAATNNIICSTPLNTVKLHLFSEDNQQMSPIHNPSSATPSDKNSPTKALDAAQELKNNLQITKIKMDTKKEPAKLSQIRKDSQESEYIFPLVNVPVLKMMICDSEEETLPKKIKRGKKPTVLNLSSHDIDTGLKQKKSKIANEKNIIETIPVIENLENRELIQTRSKTESMVSENDRIEQKKGNSKTKNDSSSLKLKKLKTSTNKTGNKQTKAILNKNKNVGQNEEVALLTARMEKIKKDIINDKTKNSLNLKKSENKNKIENNYDIFSTLNLKHKENKNNIDDDDDDIFSTTIEKAKETVMTDLKLPPDSKNNTRRKKKETDTTDKIEIDELSSKKSTTIQKLNNSDIRSSKKRGRPTKAKNSSKNSNRTDNKTTNSNNTIETSDNFNNIKNSQFDKNGPVQNKNSNIDENSLEIRRSERKRIQSSKYWISSYQLSNADLNVQMDEEFKKPSLMSRRLHKSADVVVNKFTKTQHTPNIDEYPTISSETDKIHKLETSVSKRSLRLVEAAVGNKSPKKSNDVVSEEIPITLQEPQVVEKSLLITKTSEKSKLNEYTKDNLSRQSLQSNRRQSFRKSRINESKILTAGKIRKSLAFEKKIATPKRITKNKKTANLQASAKNTSYTTEEEDGIPRDTLLLNNAELEAPQIPSHHGMKRKVETNVDLNISKKVRVQTDNEFSFKKMAILADISPAKAGGLADVQIEGKRCLLGCFGKFPRDYTTYSDISIGKSINNTFITTGILEIEPEGRKKYEYAKKADLLFVVLEGIAEVGIGNSSQVLRLGQDFYVPKDTSYYILNISNTSKLLLYFSKFSR